MDFPQQHPEAQPCPSSHLGLALVSSILCQLCGIVALVYAAQVSGEWRMGHYERAREYSGLARGWALAGLVLTGVIVLIVVLVVWGSSTPGSGL